MSRKSLTPLDFLTDYISPPKSENSTNPQMKSPKLAGNPVQTSPETIKKEPHSSYRKGYEKLLLSSSLFLPRASPTTYGPSPTELPPFERSASGAILLERWGNSSDSPLISPRPSQTQQKRQQVPPNHFQQNTVPKPRRQETIEDVQTRIKAEVDAARYKIAAAEAHNEVERFKKLLS